MINRFNRKWILYIGILTIFVFGIFIDCAFKRNENNIGTSRNSSSLEELDLKILSKTMGYALGSPFDMKMRLTNKGGKTIELHFPNGYAYDFFIYQKNELIYRFSEDENYPTGLKKIELAPEDSIVLGGIWLCKDRNGDWVRGGRYQLIGVINTDPPIISDILPFGLTD